MMHRHLEYPAETTTEDLPSAAIVDTLERGDLDDWRPIALAVARDPYGGFASRVLALLAAYPMYGTSALWRAWIDRCRARTEPPLLPERPASLTELRNERGLTQTELAERIGMAQSDLSKLERRGDVRVSTLRAYLAGLGGTLGLYFQYDAAHRPIVLGAPRAPHDGEAEGTPS